MNITMLTDASYCPDKKVAGYGFWIACARGKVGGGGQIGQIADINSAEMLAVCNTIVEGSKRGLILAGDNLLIQTDSLAAIDRLQGVRPVALTDEQRDIILKYSGHIFALQLGVEFRHVKAHTNSKLARFTANRMCDRRARAHMRAARAATIAMPHLKQILEGLVYEANARY